MSRRDGHRLHVSLQRQLELAVSSPHRALLLRSRSRIEEILRLVTRASHVAPWDIFVVIADARGEFAKELVTLIAETHGTCGVFESSDDADPWLCVPLLDGGGIELLSAVAPFIITEVLTRPARTVALFVVDAADDPLIAFGRLIWSDVS